MKYIITGYKGFVGSSLYKLFPESFVFEKDDIYDEKDKAFLLHFDQK